LSHQNGDPNKNPILFGFGTSFERLRVCQDSQNENFLKAAFFNHPMFYREAGNKITLDPEFLSVKNPGKNIRKKS
jgi:hypothetical protein